MIGGFQVILIGRLGFQSLTLIFCAGLKRKNVEGTGFTILISWHHWRFTIECLGVHCLRWIGSVCFIVVFG